MRIAGVLFKMIGDESILEADALPKLEFCIAHLKESIDFRAPVTDAHFLHTEQVRVRAMRVPPGALQSA
jgi:hypothetical protein